ncbi:hypothetical protein ACIBF1_32040 [Spirillospora sp. NPDC050679]
MRPAPAPPESPFKADAFERPQSTPEPPGIGPSRIIRPGLSSGIAVAAIAALVAGGIAYLVRDGGGDGAPAAGTREAARQNAGARPAEALFPVPPALFDGHEQAVTGVASRGGTVVTIGSETAGRPRGQFLVSDDGGKQWRSAAGGDGVPKAVAAGPKGWAALGEGGGVVTWSSPDGEEWTARPGDPSAFQEGDEATALAATASGFVGAGTSKDGRPVVWSSADGATWQRVAATGLKGAPTRLVASGDTLVMQGEDGVLRSTDGKAWTPVEIPQSDGSYGGIVGLAAGPGGFYAAREGRGRSKKKRPIAVFFRSVDGVGWARSGVIDRRTYVRLSAFGGSEAGLAAVAPLSDGRLAVHRSDDGASWQPVERLDAGGGRKAESTIALPKGVLVAGRQDNGAYLAAPGAKHGDVDLLAVPGAVTPDRTLARLVAGAGTVLAVGSGNGDAAVWGTRDGGAWTRAGGTGMTGAGVQRLAGAAHGPAGWVAVGRGADRTRPLLLTSSDGTAWQAAGVGSGAGELSGVAHGPAGAVAVGWTGSSAASWSSRDLKRWTAGGGDLKDAWMRDVAAVSGGYAAVGGRKGDRPAVWTSPDGGKWTSAALPPEAGSGALFQVAAKGDTLVALGRNVLVTSADGGRTWKAQAVPSDALTAVTATPRGFVVAGETGSDVALWTSADGASWRMERPRGDGLAGDGAQRLTGLAVLGGDLLAVGTDRDGPTLWRRPLP